VIHPYKPRVGTCLRNDFFVLLGRLVDDRFDRPRTFFAIVTFWMRRAAGSTGSARTIELDRVGCCR